MKVEDIVAGQEGSHDANKMDAERMYEDMPAEDIPAGVPWYLSPTGDGSVDEYVTHPLNFSESKGLAQIIRGLEGMLDSLDYALVDIAVGAFRYYSEVSTGADEDGTDRGGDREHDEA